MPGHAQCTKQGARDCWLIFSYLSPPSLHPAGQRNTYFNTWSIIGWILTAVLHAGIILACVLQGASPWTAERDR